MSEILSTGMLTAAALAVLMFLIGVASNWFKRPIWLKTPTLVAVIVLLVALSVYVGILKEDASGGQANLGDANENQTKASGQIIPSPPRVELDNTHGWGPARTIFTMRNPAPYAVFNSIIDNSNHGDERNFFQCHDVLDTNWQEELIARDGHNYECYIYFDNDVAPNLDKGNLAAQIHNGRARVLLPQKSIFNPGLISYLSADNAVTVWSSCNFVAPQPMTVIYVNHTARIFTKGVSKNGLALNESYNGDSVMDGLTGPAGALLGYSKQDGIVRQGAGYLLFNVRVKLGAL